MRFQFDINSKVISHASELHMKTESAFHIIMGCILSIWKQMKI